MAKKIFWVVVPIILIASILVLFFYTKTKSEGSTLDSNNLTYGNDLEVEDNTIKEEGWKSYTINELDGYLGNNNNNNAEIIGGKSILLLGIDSRDESLTGRSDSILLLNLNKEGNIATLVSIPRDSYVYVEGKGYDKINHAYAYGGSELSKKAVENLLGVKIDHVASVNFKSFEKIIDILGGVEVDVPFDFTEKLSNGNLVEFKKGTLLLNGEHALAYARMRKQDNEGDLGRGKRQQEIIGSLINEVKDISNVLKIKDLYNETNKNIKTDMTLTDILQLLPSIKSLNNIEKLQLEGSSVMIDRVSYIKLNENSLFKIKEKLKNENLEE